MGLVVGKFSQKKADMAESSYNTENAGSQAGSVSG